MDPSHGSLTELEGDPSKSWKEIGSKTLQLFMDPSQSWKEIGSKISYLSWIPHRVGRRLVVKHYILRGSLTELERDW